MKKILFTILVLLCVLLASCSKVDLHIGENGNWWNGETDLGITAQGPQGEKGETGDSLKFKFIEKIKENEKEITYKITFSDGSSTTFIVKNGDDGNTPYIGENGNWWISNEDTGIKVVYDNMDRKGTEGLLFRTTIRGGIAGYEVYGYSGAETDIVIPNYILNKPVVSISQDALPTSITSISISSNTEYLPKFENYKKLTYFDFNNAPVSVLSVNSFKNCEVLEKIDNYENIEIVSQYAFYNTALTDFDFSGVKEIHEYAFYDCLFFDIEWRNFEADIYGFVYIPNNVEVIKKNAFNDICIYYAGNTPEYQANLLYSNVETSKDGYYYIDNGEYISLINYVGKNSEIVLPKKIDDKPVTTLPNYAFYSNNKIKRVEVSNSVTLIENDTFANCKKLHSVFIPTSVEKCGNFTSINNYLNKGFESTTLFFNAIEIYYVDGVTSPSSLGLSKYMMGVSPSEITDDDVCVYYKERESTNYEVVTIKNIEGVVTIPAKHNNLQVSKINKYALYGATLTTSINISDGIEKISTKSFYNSSKLKIVNIPSSVDLINYQGFYNLSNCSIYIKVATKPENWDNSWYYSVGSINFGYDVRFDETGSYLYEIVEDKIYLKKYLKQIIQNEPIIIPAKIDGKIVYGVRQNCFYLSDSTSSANRYKFVISSSIAVMEYRSIYLSNGNKNSDFYLYFSSSNEIPSTWNSNWYYISGILNKYYAEQWEMVDGVPTIK